MSDTQTEKLTILCPSCGYREEKVTLEAPADVQYACRVYAEVDLTADLAADKVKRDEYAYAPERYMPDFRLDEVTDRIEEIEHGNLRLDAVNHRGEAEVIAFCFNCQADVTEQFRALLDKAHPLEKE